MCFAWHDVPASHFAAFALREAVLEDIFVGLQDVLLIAVPRSLAPGFPAAGLLAHEAGAWR